MKTIKFQTPQKALLFSLVLLFGFAAFVVLMFWTGQRALSAYWESRALKAGEGEELSLDQRVENMFRAVQVERRDDGAWRNLSQLLLAQATKIANQKPSEDEKKNQQALERLGNASRNAIKAAQNATDLDNKNPTNWENLGNVFLNLIPFGQGAADQAIAAYDKALKYDPQNPALHLKKAQAKYAQAQRVTAQIRNLSQTQNQKSKIQKKQLNEQINAILAQAEEFAKKATEAKPNYASAHMFLTNVYDVQGEVDEAISSLSNVVILNPQNAGLYFQLGLLYYKKDQMPQAEAAFRQAISINSDYANARYFLGLTYSRQDKGEKAIKQFEKVAEANPDNKEVETIIANLKAGKPLLEGIVPPAPEPAEREQAPVEEQTP